MKKQSSALSRLETIFRETLRYDHESYEAGDVLKQELNSQDEMQACLELFELISLAQREALKIELSNPDDVRQLFSDLVSVLEIQRLSNTQWITVKNAVERARIIPLLSSYASHLYKDAPEVSLPEDILENLLTEFESLIDKVRHSGLDQSLQLILIEHLEAICSSIRRYSIVGTKGLRVSTEALLGNLSIQIHSINKENQNENPILKRIFSSSMALISILGLGADIDGFLIPKLQTFNQRREAIEAIISDYDDLQEAVGIVFKSFQKLDQKQLIGHEPKYLPEAKELNSSEEE